MSLKRWDFNVYIRYFYNDPQVLGFQHIDKIYVLCLSNVVISTQRHDDCIMSLECLDFDVWIRCLYYNPQVLGFQHIDKIYLLCLSSIGI
jgi:hypothetical protein